MITSIKLHNTAKGTLSLDTCSPSGFVDRLKSEMVLSTNSMFHWVIDWGFFSRSVQRIRHTRVQTDWLLSVNRVEVSSL